MQSSWSPADALHGVLADTTVCAQTHAHAKWAETKVLFAAATATRAGMRADEVRVFIARAAAFWPGAVVL